MAGNFSVNWDTGLNLSQSLTDVGETAYASGIKNINA
jgi:hypothetical protein